MAFRFWRRIRIAPGVTLNLSKSGGSLSFGPRGAKFTIGPRGNRATVGIDARHPWLAPFGCTVGASKSAVLPICPGTGLFLHNYVSGWEVGWQEKLIPFCVGRSKSPPGKPPDPGLLQSAVT